MLNLTPRRRRAATAAGAATTAAAAALIMIDSHSNALHFVCGFIIGISLAINIGNLIRNRRTCS